MSLIWDRDAKKEKKKETIVEIQISQFQLMICAIEVSATELCILTTRSLTKLPIKRWTFVCKGL